MDKVYEFNAHPYELLKNNRRVAKCRVWEPNADNPSVVVLEYAYGANINDEKLEKLGQYICKKHNMAVMVVEYGGTTLKYSDDLVSKLEKLLPKFLNNISAFLNEKYKIMIKEGRYQDVINELYFYRFANYPVYKDTLIPLYGDDEEYQDYGLTPAMDILYGIQYAKEIYPDWNWKDCVGYGKGYGAYLIQMAEKLSPNTFSAILSLEGKFNLEKMDLFCNMTEWEYGKQKNFIMKSIGRFPIYLVEKFGWTTNQEHENAFKPWHYDIRNIKNKDHLAKEGNNRNTPYIFVDIMNEQDFIDIRKDYIDTLIENNYSLECWVIDENEVDGKIVKKDENGLWVDEKNLFTHYINKYPNRNVYKEKNNFIYYYVNSGVYIIYDLSGYPKVQFINNDNFNKVQNTINNIDEVTYVSENVKKYLEKPINRISEEYTKLVSE